MYALPYFVLLGILAGFNSVYLTKSVIFFKNLFASIENEYLKVIAGSLFISTLIFFFPALYGEGYSGVRNLIAFTPEFIIPVLLPLVSILLLKPVITSVTLGVGGDGGVFAPSLFIGAFLGLLVCVSLNHFFYLALIPVNFMLIGMAAVLSGSIHAPFTAIFLVCAIAGNYVLFVPIVVACLVANWVAYLLFPYTVYTFKPVKSAVATV